jgi:hypothetical protein
MKAINWNPFKNKKLSQKKDIKQTKVILAHIFGDNAR